MQVDINFMLSSKSEVPEFKQKLFFDIDSLRNFIGEFVRENKFKFIDGKMYNYILEEILYSADWEKYFFDLEDKDKDKERIVFFIQKFTVRV